MNRDPQFGPLVMFGLGGIYVEVLKDVTFRVAPMSAAQAKSMIESIRSYKLLTGVRRPGPLGSGRGSGYHPAHLAVGDRFRRHRRVGHQPAAGA
jgi:hypothetical protein